MKGAGIFFFLNFPKKFFLYFFKFFKKRRRLLHYRFILVTNAFRKFGRNVKIRLFHWLGGGRWGIPSRSNASCGGESVDSISGRASDED